MPQMYSGEKARSEASACVSFGVRSATAARTISPRAANEAAQRDACLARCRERGAGEGDR